MQPVGPEHQSDDQTLVQMVRAGQCDAFSILYERYRSAVYGIVLGYIRDPQSARDITQEAFLVAFRSIQHLRNSNRFAAWICSIGRNRAARTLRRRRSIPIVPISEQDPMALHDIRAWNDPEITVERDQIAELVHAAVFDLPKQLRDVLELRYWQGLTVNQIALSLGIPESTVKWRLHQGKKTLRLRLKEE